MKKSVGAKELIFPNPVFVVGTYDEHDMANAATFAWAGIASSGPKAVSVAVRPSRYTYENLILKKAFTVNLPSAEHASEADYFGIVSGRDEDKFARTGLTPIKGDFVDAPLIEEFPYNMECVVSKVIELGAHILFIGEIKDIKVSENLIDENGHLTFMKAGILAYDNADMVYRTSGKIVAKGFSAGKKFFD
ncbi:MAG: flavin reductase family protein [Clostridiales Family XIII bacterium]|jgi:flavin reductase (DIM6/NTAB) family NADH-FMN oxidoreductase RutF|nr:flavin reductase family protein [Clostridiales Family XIII bacterium]